MKKTSNKLTSLVLGVAMLMLCLTSCGSSSDSTDSTASTDSTSSTDSTVAAQATVQPETVDIEEGASVSQLTDITAAITVDITTMDPLDTSDTLSGGIQRMVMDGLFGFNDAMEVIPMLATEYEANDDATEFIFTLREGIYFSDGTPWNAEAAKANFDRWADPTLGLKRTSLLSSTLDTTEVIDEYTIKVTLQAPFGAFINTLAHPACVCMSPVQIEAGQEACAYDPIGTGQYTYVEWVAGEHVIIELNTDWWGYDADLCGGTPLADSDAGFKTVTFIPVSENATRVAMLQAGEAQVTWSAPEESLDLLKADESLNVEISDGIVVYFLTMNNMKAPFDNVLVRQAINYAIDKDAYCTVVRNGLATPATSAIGSAVQYYVENDPYPYDPEYAMELLAEAGYPDGFTTKLTYSTTTSNIKQAEFMQQQLALVGITVELDGYENAVVNDLIQNTDVDGSEAYVDLYIAGWSPSTGDADWALRPLLATESFPPNNYNMAYYSNERYDELLYEALASADHEIRGAAYEEAQNLIWEECPAVYLSCSLNSIVTSSNISGVTLFPDNAINMRNGKMA